MREFVAAPQSTSTPARLNVSTGADGHEHAADRIADLVVRGEGPGAVRRMGPAGVGRPVREPARAVPASVAEELGTAGRPLDGETRAEMEGRFGHDFSRVRVHEGGSAARSAREVEARAYTVGNDVVFGAGEYAPRTTEGRRLLAHELAHTIGQTASTIRWLDRQPVKMVDNVEEKPAAPYFVVPARDEVAIRSSPSPRRAGAPFHNLVGSLKKDARLLVKDRQGHWMKVWGVSGTALDGRTNEPRPAAGLVGYVSEELLVRTNEPVPTPIRPTEYHSLDQFSKAWPYQDTTGEAKKVWLGQSKQAWTEKALAAAGVRAGDWQPRAGFRRTKQIFEKVYAYYASLYLADHRLKWAAMAKLAGGEVFRGFRDEIVPAEELGEAISKAGRRSDGDLSVGDLIGGVAQAYAGSIDILLMQMQHAIFMDLAWQHQAYREGGIEVLAAAAARGELDKEGFAAWQDIDSGVSTRVSKGNLALLRREQFLVLQGGGRGGFYKKIQDIPDNDAIPDTMSEKAVSPIPGGRPFAEIVPGGDITKFDDRWKWLESDMIPAFEKLKPDELERLVKKSLGELANRKFN